MVLPPAVLLETSLDGLITSEISPAHARRYIRPIVLGFLIMVIAFHVFWFKTTALNYERALLQEYRHLNRIVNGLLPEHIVSRWV
jgi:hypothetical protein